MSSLDFDLFAVDGLALTLPLGLPVLATQNFYSFIKQSDLSAMCTIFVCFTNASLGCTKNFSWSDKLIKIVAVSQWQKCDNLGKRTKIHYVKHGFGYSTLFFITVVNLFLSFSGFKFNSLCSCS